MMRALTIALLVAACAMPAQAQSGPSFDCGKSLNSLDRAICGDVELSAADLKMAEAYKALLDSLDDPAREHAQKDQARWLANRNRACINGAVETALCLKNRYRVRLEILQTLAVGSYPFVSTQAVERRGTVKAIKYFVDALFPQFDGTWADFKETNLNFEGTTKEAVAEAVPAPDTDAGREQTWNYEQSFTLFRPGERALTVVTSYYGFTGGANGGSGVNGALVDLRTGLLMAPSEIFAPGDGWRTALRDMVIADLRRQFVERPGFADALEPAKMDKQLRETRHYVWKADGLHVVFNQYDVAARVMGPYTVSMPYEKLRPLMRPDAPVGQ